MDIAYVFLSFLVCFLCVLGQHEKTCGHLKVVYEYKTNSIDCRIRLYPSSELKTEIEESHFYRWILVRNVSSTQSSKIILQKNSEYYNRDKYNEEDFTLLVRNLSPLDEGRYEVECWDRHQFFISDKVMVRLPALPTKKPGPDTSGSAGDAGIGNTAIIVISICVVVIVAIISGTIYLIRGKQRGGNQEVKRLVSDEGTSSIGHAHHVCNENPSSIYSEIDHGELILDYAKVDQRQIKPLDGQSKEMPIATHNLRRKDVIETDRDINDSFKLNDALVSETAKIEVEYADIIVELPDDTLKATEAQEENSYDYINVENGEKTITHIYDKANHDNAKESNAFIDSMNAPNGHIYAKVLKGKPKNKGKKVKVKSDTQDFNNKEYSLQFPDINCSKITMSLGDSIFLQQATQIPEPVKYSNLECRPKRDEKRVSRASRKELHYAILDLPDHSSRSVEDKVKELTIHGQLQPCQYDAIDFGRKAFVAPIRKAPSSWYRRKEKRNKTRKDRN